MIANSNEHGGLSIENILELLLTIAVVPPIICCIAQAVVMVLAVTLPWLIIAAIAIAIAGAVCVGTAMIVRRRYVPPMNDPMPPFGLPPVRLPHLGDRREERF